MLNTDSRSSLKEFQHFRGLNSSCKTHFTSSCVHLLVCSSATFPSYEQLNAEELIILFDSKEFKMPFKYNFSVFCLPSERKHIQNSFFRWRYWKKKIKIESTLKIGIRRQLPKRKPIGYITASLDKERRGTKSSCFPIRLCQRKIYQPGQIRTKQGKSWQSHLNDTV